MEVRPIKTEEDYRAALRLVETLMDAAPGSPEEDCLEVWGTLVRVYEAKHYPMPPPDPIEAILYQMEKCGISRKELEKYIGPRGRVSEVLNRKRPLSIEMIRKVNAHMDIPAEVLLQDYLPKPPKGTRKMRGIKT